MKKKDFISLNDFKWVFREFRQNGYYKKIRLLKLIFDVILLINNTFKES